MRKTIFTAIVASGFFVATGTALADELPEPGTECTAREAAQTRHEGITLEDGRIVQCLKDETNPRERVWTVTFEPEADEPEPEDDDEDTGTPDEGTAPDEDDSPSDEPTDNDDDSGEPDTGTEDEDEDEEPEPSPKPTSEAESDEDERKTSEAGKDETVKVEPVSGASGGQDLAVTGGALTGLILGGLVLLGGGGTAAYLARKRKA